MTEIQTGCTTCRNIHWLVAAAGATTGIGHLAGLTHSFYPGVDWLGKASQGALIAGDLTTVGAGALSAYAFQSAPCSAKWGGSPEARNHAAYKPIAYYGMFALLYRVARHFDPQWDTLGSLAYRLSATYFCFSGGLEQTQTPQAPGKSALIAVAAMGIATYLDRSLSHGIGSAAGLYLAFSHTQKARLFS